MNNWTMWQGLWWQMWQPIWLEQMQQQNQTKWIQIQLMRTWVSMLWVMIAVEALLFWLSNWLPNLYWAIPSLFWESYRFFLHIWIFFYFFYKWIWENESIRLSHRIWILLTAFNIYFFAVLYFWRTVSWPFYIPVDLIWEQYKVSFIIWFTFFNLLYSIFAYKEWIAYLKENWLWDTLFWKEEKEEVEEVPKILSIEDKIKNWASKKLNNSFPWTKVLSVTTWIPWYVLIVQPWWWATFNEIINFAWERLQTKDFITNWQEEVLRWKRVVSVIMSRPMDLNDKEAVKKRQEHLKRQKKLNLIWQLKKDKELQKEFYWQKDTIIFWLDVFNNYVKFNLFKWPHYVVFWETMSWKSVAMHNMIAPLMTKMSPYEFQVFIVDPKWWVEFAQFYDKSPHCTMFPPTRSENVWRETYWMLWLIKKEYTRRLSILRKYWVREVETLPDRWNTIKKHNMPYILIAIDEYLELKTDWDYWRSVNYELIKMMSIVRFAWIHIILATQKPTSDVIDWKLKLNAPVKIWLKVDRSRTSTEIIWDWSAAKLQWMWDAIFNFWWKNKRFQSMFLSNESITEIVTKQAEEYHMFKAPSDEEYSKMIKEWIKFFERSWKDEDTNQEDEETTWKSMADVITEKDFMQISKEVKEVFEKDWDAIDADSPLRFKEAQKMLTYIFDSENWKLDKWVLKVFPTLWRKDYNVFRNLLIKSEAVMSESEDIVSKDDWQALIPRANTIWEFIWDIEFWRKNL